MKNIFASMDYSKLYDLFVRAHSFLPYYLLNGKSFPPLRVQLDLTYRCNLRCSICYQGEIYKNAQKELTAEEWIRVIRQLPPYSLTTFMGGEPLVHSGFKRIAAEALRNHVCNLVTNGVLLDSETNHFLIAKKLIMLGVSLDGVGSVHDQIRGVDGTYDRVIKNLKDLREQKKKKRARFPLLDVKTVVTDSNMESLCGLFQTSEELGADFFTVSLPKVSKNQFHPELKDELPCFPSFDFSLIDKIDFPGLKSVLKKMLDCPHKTKIRFYPEVLSLETFDKLLYEPENLLKKFLPCRQPWTGVQIGATGEVYPCLSLKLGNVRNNSFASIWNNKKSCGFRRDLRKVKLFPDCLGCCYLKQK